MHRYALLEAALDFIEANLENALTQETIAAACHCSLSSLQKLFRYALHLGVMDYVGRRRLTLAAQALHAGQACVTDIALLYQYASPEVFIRAFRRQWGMTPTAFRQAWRFDGLFPRVEGLTMRGDGTMRRKVDISDLYEQLKACTGAYVVSFDIVGLLGINDISRTAGDLAILTCLKRIDEVAGEDMLVFRTGGDEFALVTGMTDRQAVEAVMRRVLSENGKIISHAGQDIPLSMRACAMRMGGGNLKYAELFARLEEAVDKTVDPNEPQFLEG